MAEERSRRSRRAPVAQTGRSLGPRALRTRRRIMDATAELLEERSVLDLPVVDIARRAGASPATFYHYFKDVEEVALCLAEEASESLPAVARLLETDWKGPDGLDLARGLVDAFLESWDRHHTVLMLRNMASERGDRRFQRVRRESIGPVLEALARSVERGQAQGRLSKELHPWATAAALGSILERLAAHHRDLGSFGATREDVRESSARIVYQTLVGRPPDL